MSDRLIKNIIYIFGLGAVIILGIIGAIPQDLSYHSFADEREMLGIPNFMNVVTNIPFAFVGLFGFLLLLKSRFDRSLKLINSYMYLGFLLLALGSSYYHLNPCNSTLVWDRIPMTMVFASFFILVIMELYEAKKTMSIFIGTALAGVGSVLFWVVSSKLGAEDLRAYAFMQFFPMLVIPFILLTKKSRTGNANFVWMAMGCYVFAKLGERFDQEIFDMLKIISGHSLKHLMACLSVFYIYKFSVSKVLPNHN